MKPPPTIQPDPIPGPDYDPLDRLVQDLQNIESFLSHLSATPQDIPYLNTHLSGILGLRRSISQQLAKLSEEPYNYSPSRIQKLQGENEKLFIFIEGVAGEVMAKDEKKLAHCLNAAEEILFKFDEEITP